MDTADSYLVDPLEQDLAAIIPIEMEFPEPPFKSQATEEEKIRLTLKALRRSIELKNRTMSLVNAFHLGKLFNESESTAIKFRNKQKTTKHYAVMAEYTFDIFEPDPSQLLQTTLLTVQQVKKLKKWQVLQYRGIIANNTQIVFDGAQN